MAGNFILKGDVLMSPKVAKREAMEKGSPFCEHCKEDNCAVSNDGTCGLIRRYLKAVKDGVHVCEFGMANKCLTCGVDFVKEQPQEGSE